MKNTHDKFLNEYYNYNSRKNSQNRNILLRIIYYLFEIIFYIVFDIIIHYIKLGSRRMSKYCLRVLKHTSELERICSSEKVAASRIRKIGK